MARIASKAITDPDVADAPNPDSTLVEEVISAAFWASLKREEGRSPKISDQRDSIALVASHDGRFTGFAWSATAQMVHAHRPEALLL